MAMKSRRKFLQNLTVAGIAATLPIQTMANPQDSQKMIHQVFFWLADKEGAEAFKKEAAVLGKCKTVAKFYMGTPAPTERRDVVDHSFQVACTLFFDSIEDQDYYQTDPLHLAFIEKNSKKWTQVKVYDFIF